MDDVLLLISGASGAGKTSVRNAIAADLGPAVEAVELCHLDTVPAAPDLARRQRMAERAVQRAGALEKCGRHLLLAGDPVAPGEVLAAAIPRHCCRITSRSRTGCDVTPTILHTCRMS